MHAYLIVGRETKRVEEAVLKLVSKLKASPMPFPLAKIEDVRVLEGFTNLKVDKPTAIILKDFEAATVPAQNAFLKSLEEPQENLYYILTATSEHPLLPTITSRCQIIKTETDLATTKSLRQTVTFLKMTPAEKLAELDTVRARDDAKAYVEGLIKDCHRLLLSTKEKHLVLAKYIKAANHTLAALRANGNVTLQLTNMVVLMS
jgi:hypothetical protein